VGGHVDQFHVRFAEARLFQGVEQQEVADETDLHTDLLALEVRHRGNARRGDDHVVAVAVVVGEDHHVLAAGGAGDQGVTVGHGDGVELAGGKRHHGGHVVEPLELDLDAGFVEPAFLDTHFPGDPAGPVAVADLEGFRQGGGGEAEGDAGEERGAEAADGADGTGEKVDTFHGVLQRLRGVHARDHYNNLPGFYPSV